MKRWLLASTVILASYDVSAQIYKTLPKGVRLLAYRNVTTSKIKSNYNQAQAETPMTNQIDLSTKLLESAGAEYKAAIDYVRNMNPGAFDEFTLGEFKIDSEAQLNVHGFGFGFGVTDRFTVYSSLPYYKARVDVKYKQIKENNNQSLADGFYANSDVSSVIAGVAGSVPGVNGALVQSAIVNGLGYDPLGSWEGQGYGDLEAGAIYKILDRDTWGMAMTNGLVAPTGRVDDPDMLQDIGFGDGQWDVFSEIGLGASPIDGLNLGVSTRYTYQAPSKRSLRLPTPDLNNLKQKGEFDVKFGDKIDTTFSASVRLNDWFSVTPAYEFNVQGKARYESDYTQANSELEENSDRMTQIARITATVSSIQPFLKKQFLLPATINFNAQQTMAGRNVPKVSRFEVELRLLF